MVANNKVKIRKEVLKVRALMKKEEKKIKDEIIFNKLIESKIYINSKNIFTYISTEDEIDTKRFIEYALKDNKKIFVPKIIRETRDMKAIEIKSLNELEKGVMGILEPITFEGEIKKEGIDIIIVPGAVFDKEGNRIGYGGGYYDKFLLSISEKKNKIAVAYSFQVLDKIKNEPHDIKVDYIISEK
ncbi:5-formyltetrahydrofolate cyclo-ligase [Clostridium carnis]